MNSNSNFVITFDYPEVLATALNVLALEATVPYTVDPSTCSISSEESIAYLLTGNGVTDFYQKDNSYDQIDDSMDGDFDSGMASAGHGTDEDYGSCNEE